MEYTLFVQDADGENKYEVGFDSFSVTEELNTDRFARFTINYFQLKTIADTFNTNPEDILTGMYKELYLYDEDSNIIYSGFVSDISLSADKDGKMTITLASKGFMSLLGRRFTNSLRTYSSEDLGDIAWDLINYTQTLSYGDFGITRGVHPTTRNADRTYKYKNIREAIEKMSNDETKNGFDFELDNQKIFNIYYPLKGTSRPQIPLVYGENIETFNFYKPVTDTLTNQVIVFGAGQGEEQLIEVRDADDVYKNNFYLLQETISEIDIITTETLQNKGDAYLDTFKYPRKRFSCTVRYDDPSWQSYNLGDNLSIKIDFMNYQANLRVRKRTLTDDGRVSLVFDLT